MHARAAAVQRIPGFLLPAAFLVALWLFTYAKLSKKKTKNLDLNEMPELATEVRSH